MVKFIKLKINIIIYIEGEILNYLPKSKKNIPTNLTRKFGINNIYDITGINDVSEVIQTNYAFHIIKKLELDDSKYSEYLDKLREEKALKDIKETLDTLKLIYRDAYKKLKY